MTQPVNQRAYLVANGTGTIYHDVIFPRAPGVSDFDFPITQRWVDTSNNNAEWYLLNFTASNGVVSPNWVQLGGALTPIIIDGDVGSASGITINLHALQGNINSTNCGASVLFTASGSEVDLTVTDVFSNTFIGQGTGVPSGNFASGNTALGSQCLPNLNGFLASGNIAIGVQSLFDLVTGSNNTCFGNASGLHITGSNNTCLGNQALRLGVGGSDNICIGNMSALTYNGNESSNIIIGNIGVLGESNVMRLGTQGALSGQVNRCFVAGIVGVTVGNTRMVTVDSTTGQLGDAAIPIPVTDAFNQIVVQKITTTSTYTPTTGIKYCIVEILGGGGGAGGVQAGGANWSATGGAGSGCYAKQVFSAATIGVSQAVTIGAAGTGGAAGVNNGTAGGQTSFGALMTAPGGLPSGGGASTAIDQIFVGGAGGAAGTGGDTNAGGSYGGWGAIFQAVGVSPAIGGFGGDSIYGAGGGVRIPGANTDLAGLNGQGFGSGGGAGASNQGASGAAGGDGSPGVCIVTEYISM